MRIYDGNDLVNESGGRVISVLIQYRLGLFGFLAGSDVKKNGVLNAGLRKDSLLHSLLSTEPLARRSAVCSGVGPTTCKLETILSPDR